MRTPRAWRVLERAFRAGKEKEGFNVAEFSVQNDHLHLIVDTRDERTLAKGMQGLAIRIAKALNRYWRRRIGSVFAERYFARVLTTHIQLWRAVKYVLSNARKHGAWFSKDQPDPYSSGRWYCRWHERDRIRRPLRGAPVSPGRSLLFAFYALSFFSVADVPGRRQYDDCGPTELAGT